jgi:phosphohistidine phosphatase SixA
VVRGFKAYPRARRVALVGHEPDVGELAAWLVGASVAIPFRKGAVCCFDVATWPPRPPATLVWFATAKLLRAVGRSGEEDA